MFLDVSAAFGELSRDPAVATTVGHALRQAGALLLEIDSRELGALAIPAGRDGDKWGVVLYDNFPGGAGHVHELFQLERKWLEAALHRMYISDQHNRDCEHVCLDCLLTFEAQQDIARGLINRRLAYKALAEAIQGGALCDVPDHPEPLPPDRRTLLERIDRGRRAAKRND